MNPLILLIFVLGLSVSWGLIVLILKNRRLSGDTNRGKDFHHGDQVPVPRLGGLALAAAFTVCALAIAFSGTISSGNLAILAVIVVGSLAMLRWDFGTICDR